MTRNLKFLSFLLLAACSHDISKLHVPGLVPDSLQTQIQLPSQKGKSLQILYLGCGHMIIEQNGEAFFTDPFFSIQPGKKMMGKVQSKNEYHERWHKHIKSTIGLDQVQKGLVAHTHYDHVMDLPLMIDKQDFPNLQTVYGNAYLPKMLVNFKDKGVTLQSLTNQEVFNPCEEKPADSEYDWIPLTSQSRFLAIQTHHAPHALGKLFMSKPMKEKQEKYFKNTLTKPDAAIKNFKWTVGSSYAYLVDWFNGADTVRLYIQTSASRPPNGLPPAAELKKKKVDLVILCYASTPNVKKYPEYLLNAMNGADYPKNSHGSLGRFFYLPICVWPGSARTWHEPTHGSKTMEESNERERQGFACQLHHHAAAGNGCNGYVLIKSFPLSQSSSPKE